MQRLNFFIQGCPITVLAFLVSADIPQPYWPSHTYPMKPEVTSVCMWEGYKLLLSTKDNLLTRPASHLLALPLTTTQVNNLDKMGKVIGKQEALIMQYELCTLPGTVYIIHVETVILRNGCLTYYYWTSISITSMWSSYCVQVHRSSHSHTLVMLKTYLPVPLNFYENVYVISSSLAIQAELGNTGILDLVLVLCGLWVVVCNPGGTIPKSS